MKKTKFNIPSRNFTVVLYIHIHYAHGTTIRNMTRESEMLMEDKAKFVSGMDCMILTEGC